MADLREFDPYDDDLEAFHPSLYRGSERQRPRTPRRKRSAEVARERGALADRVGLREGGDMTYRPGPFERDWLGSSLLDFFEEDLIVDVLAQVKGGKEATVYRCAAGPALEQELVAAKVYRPRQFRNLANDQLYRAGRPTLAADGREFTKHDERVMRALAKRTGFGVQVQHTSWLMHEFSAMETLWHAGADVPEPIAATDNAILMTYVGDDRAAAPTLREVQLDRAMAPTVFERIQENIELLLTWGVIHGDLSAYNILWWEDEPTIIDFPQVVHPGENDAAFEIFARDVRRVCEYFARQGVETEPEQITAELWQRHVPEDAVDRAAEASRHLVPLEEEAVDDG